MPGSRLSVGKNNGVSPGKVSVLFIMLYVLGSGVDKKVTNPAGLAVDGGRRVIVARAARDLAFVPLVIASSRAKS